MQYDSYILEYFRFLIYSYSINLSFFYTKKFIGVTLKRSNKIFNLETK